MKYFQPNFYHFDQDSIELSQFSVLCLDLEKEYHLLDAYCGCGIVGLEIAKILKLKRLDFCEKQREFFPYIEKNIELDSSSWTSEIFINEFSDLDLRNYDVIVMNPPYFIKESSRISPNINKATCRSFEKYEFLALLKQIGDNLGSHQDLFLSFRDEIDSDLSSRVKIEYKKKVRKTYFYHLKNF